jgi:hypothetical protein
MISRQELKYVKVIMEYFSTSAITGDTLGKSRYVDLQAAWKDGRIAVQPFEMCRPAVRLGDEEWGHERI